MSKTLTFRHQPANPRTKKQNANPYKKKTKPLIHKKKKRKKEGKKKTNPKIQTVYPYKNIVFQTLTSTSSLQLHSHTDQNTVFQISKHTKKEIPKGSEKKRLCSSSATGKTEKLSSSSAKASDSEAIQKIIQKVGMFFSPFFCFLFNYRF